ncbi:hypothetical protein KR044_002738, partial [Drosophila immigrans]
QSELEQQFRLATTHVMAKANVYAAKDLLDLYGLYKQATEGVCATSRPSMLQMTARSKWNAWQSLGAMTKAQAQAAYIEKLHNIDAGWLDN